MSIMLSTIPTMNNVSFYVFVLIAIVIGVLLLKRVVSCLLRSVVIIALLAAIAVAYYLLVYPSAPHT